jgi:NAD(P)-dependent dehydrogenase (short-subunit alcohol dehydrogenase family)
MSVEPLYDFSGLGFEPGQVAVVSGAASGIGRSVAGILARSGVCVLAWDINAERLEALALELATTKGTVTCRRVDTSIDAEIEQAWQDVTGMEIQYLVNNAGPPSTTSMSVSDGVRQAVGGYAAMTEAFLAAHATEAASVVFTASVAGNLRVDATPDWYPAAKAGVAGYTRHLAVKLRGKPRANAVAPGGTVTERTAAAFGAPANVERFAKYPMGRPGQAWEVATAICYLLSPAASFINGVLLPVEGASTWSSNS